MDARLSISSPSSVIKYNNVDNVGYNLFVPDGSLEDEIDYGSADSDLNFLSRHTKMQQFVMKDFIGDLHFLNRYHELDEELATSRPLCYP